MMNAWLMMPGKRKLIQGSEMRVRMTILILLKVVIVVIALLPLPILCENPMNAPQVFQDLGSLNPADVKLWVPFQFMPHVEVVRPVAAPKPKAKAAPAAIYGCISREKRNHQLDKMHVFVAQFHGLEAFISGAVRLGSSTNGPQDNFGSLRHAAACCGTLRHAAACCGMLRHASSCWSRVPPVIPRLFEYPQDLTCQNNTKKAKICATIERN